VRNSRNRLSLVATGFLRVRPLARRAPESRNGRPAAEAEAA
jgi:hypothetical protein